MRNDAIAFPDPGYEAIIFDLDGTLVDSMPAHFQSWCRALEDHGAPGVFGEDVFYAMGGRAAVDIIEILNGEQGLQLDPEAVALCKRRHFMDCIDQVEFIDEVIDFAKAHAGKVPLAIASGGTRMIVEKTLQVLGVSDLFDEVVTSDEVKHGKPAPDIFLEAASRLEVEPSKCVVFEDAPAGIKSARDAGMEVVIVPTQLHIY